MKMTNSVNIKEFNPIDEIIRILTVEHHQLGSLESKIVRAWLNNDSVKPYLKKILQFIEKREYTISRRTYEVCDPCNVDNEIVILYGSVEMLPPLYCDDEGNDERTCVKILEGIALIVDEENEEEVVFVIP